MKVCEVDIPGILLIEPEVYGDDRGYFFESFNEQKWRGITGLEARFVQDNQSRSMKGVVRGLHYQIGRPQGKLVRILSGEIFDVAVDLRRNSPYYGKWSGAVLSAENKRQMWIPEGFAHGFCVLSDSAEFFYKCTDFYFPEGERGIAWNDPDIGIDWPFRDGVFLSDIDRRNPLLKNQRDDDLP